MTEKDYIFGIRPAIEAIQAGREINKIMLQKGANDSLMRELTDLLKDYRHLVQYVPIQKLNRITRKNHQGVIAFISPVDYYDLESVIPGIYESGEVPLIMVLDRITDIRNFGAIGRTAECMGAHAIVVTQKGSALINGDALKTSAGALNRIPVCRVRFLDEAVKYLKSSGIKIVGCTEKATKIIEECDYKDPVAIVMGSEEDGISGKMMSHLDDQVKIKMYGHTASLNVAVASGMLLYEISKQRSA